MNVLVTAAGRQNYLVRALKDAVHPGGRVLACDVTADAPALHEADKGFLVPSIREAAAYLQSLLDICERERVGLLIPGLEPELVVLSSNRALFAKVGTHVVVSSPEVVATCYDKLRAASFLSECGVCTPKTWTTLDAAQHDISRGRLAFPVVLKPRWGVGSIGIAFPEDHEELALSYAIARRVIASSMFAAMSATDPARCTLIQERVAGDEYGLDIVNDLHGRHVCTFVKRKLRMRAGQTDRAVTVADERIGRIGTHIGATLAHVGVLDCDLVATNAGVFVLDLNPRIGGGYPFSHIAGANVPAALVAWASGLEPDQQWLQVRPHVRAARYDAFVATADVE